MTSTSNSGPAIDLAEVQRLVDALESDLAQVQSGSKDVQALRDEVEALRAVLQGADTASAVTPQLHKVHSSLDDLIDSIEAAALVPADYIARIGRLLGM